MVRDALQKPVTLARGKLRLTSVPFVPVGEGELLQRIEGTSLIQ
jgi:hypothetical protein